SQGPTFTSQTLLQSLRGFDKKSSTEVVSVARVSWSVFTPRFLAENKTSTGAHARVELWSRAPLDPGGTAFKGPYDTVRYNDDSDTSVFAVDRPDPSKYTGQPYSSQGAEVELLGFNS